MGNMVISRETTRCSPGARPIEAQEMDEVTGAVSGILDYATAPGGKGILSRCTILPTPTIRMSPSAMLKSSSRRTGCRNLATWRRARRGAR